MSLAPIIVSGPPSAGKTQAIRRLLNTPFPYTAGVVKLDCLHTEDDMYLQKYGIPTKKILAGNICPDHYLMEHMPMLEHWQKENGFDVLVIETAGLCGRCAPYTHDSVSVCVLDCTAGIHAPHKVGPLLLDADMCVLTKGDLVSQAEREVFVLNISTMRASLRCVHMNGITGEGVPELQKHVLQCLRTPHRKKRPSVNADLFRTPLPRMYCAHCLGNTRVPVSAP